jgi:hypothetical protein
VDNLHLNGLGQAMMAELWHDALTAPTPTPGSACPAPIYIVEDVLPYDYKQNLLEVGNAYYLDEVYSLADIPAALSEGRWIMTKNADASNTDEDFMSFDVGTNPVTVYVAYEPGATPPAWLRERFSATSQQVLVSGAPVAAMDLYRATGVTGIVSLGGNMADGPNGASVNYFVVVVP